MFTGLVKDIGTVAGIEKTGDWTIKIKPKKLSLFDLSVGASIACSGICLTVVAKTFGSFQVQVSAETLSKTTALKWEAGTRLNLEPALRLSDSLGGHIVTGHVDGVAFLVAKERAGDSLTLRFEAPHELARFLAPKGSVALDGVSLTVNEVDHAQFTINIIPHTQEETTLSELSIGGGVNFEIDMLARYVERLMRPQ